MDKTLFRAGLSRFGSGVTIITTHDEKGQPTGFTASSFTSLSLDPPLVLFCLSRNSNCFQAFAANPSFAVNILKDSDNDLKEGRRFLPKNLDRKSVFDRARSDLTLAAEYVLLLQRHGAARGSVAFTALPVHLARLTLERVEQVGPGTKVSRETVMNEVTALNQRLDQGLPAIDALS